MGKKKINTVLVAWDSWELDGELTLIIAKLQKIITDNPGFFDFKMDVNVESDSFGSCSAEIKITGFRLETDEEFQDRREAEAISKENKRLMAIRDAENMEKEEKLLYESLKRKFEKEINESHQ